MEEIWNPINGYEKSYEISNLGKIRSLDRIINGRKKKGKLLKLINLGNWYTLVNLSRKTFTVHRLIAQEFIPNIYNKPFVNHIDGNKQNYNIDNLEWVTAKENSQHASRMGLLHPGVNYGVKHGKSRKVYKYSLNGEFIEEYNFMREAALLNNASENQICRVCSQEKGTCNEFQWRYYKTEKLSAYTRKWKNRSGAGISYTLYN